MEAGYTEKVDELCERYSLKEFLKVTGMTNWFLGNCISYDIECASLTLSCVKLRF